MGMTDKNKNVPDRIWISNLTPDHAPRAASSFKELEEKVRGLEKEAEFYKLLYDEIGYKEVVKSLKKKIGKIGG